MRRRCAIISYGICSSRTAVSPYAWYSVHGTQTPASDQIAVASGLPKSSAGEYLSTSGTTNGMTPSACCCSSDRSRSQSPRNALVSNR